MIEGAQTFGRPIHTGVECLLIFCTSAVEMMMVCIILASDVFTRAVQDGVQLWICRRSCRACFLRSTAATALWSGKLIGGTGMMVDFVG